MSWIVMFWIVYALFVGEFVLQFFTQRRANRFAQKFFKLCEAIAADHDPRTHAWRAMTECLWENEDDRPSIEQLSGGEVRRL